MPSPSPRRAPSSDAPLSRGDRAWRALFVAAALLVLAGSVIDSPPDAISDVDDKLQHLLAFAALGALARRGFPALPLWQLLVPALLAYGLAIECIQWLLPWREFSLLDLAADAAGLVPGALAADAWRRRRRTRSGDHAP